MPDRRLKVRGMSGLHPELRITVADKNDMGPEMLWDELKGFESLHGVKLAAPVHAERAGVWSWEIRGFADV